MVSSKGGRGLFRKTDGGVFYARRSVPKALPARIGRVEFIKSTETTDSRLAERRRDDFFDDWEKEIVEARAAGLGPRATLAELLDAIERWREARCEAAAGILAPAGPLPDFPISGKAWLYLRTASTGTSRTAYNFSQTPGRRRVEIGDGAVDWAQGYYEARPAASRDVASPPKVALLLGRLQMAEREADRWRELEGFDHELSKAASVAGLAAALSPKIIEQARQPFARAWRQVVQYEEAERQRAAAILVADEASKRHPGELRVAPAPLTYVRREDDKTIKELTDAYQAYRGESYGDTEKKYRHVFRALEEALGAEKPLRAVSRSDVERVKHLLRRLPAHMSKRREYSTLDLLAAADLADTRDEARRLAPNTVNSYLANLSAMFGWAVRKEWLEQNPAVNIIDRDMPAVKRRGFTPSELEQVFASLTYARNADSASFWVPAKRPRAPANSFAARPKGRIWRPAADRPHTRSE